MRRKNVIRVATILLVMAGIILICVGVFAYQLGLDNNDIIGPKRKVMILTGILSILFPPLVAGLQVLNRKWQLTEKFVSFTEKIAGSGFFYWLDRPINTGKNRPEKQTRLWAISGSAAVILAVIWLLTAGRMTHWMPYTSYFDKQADGFLAGQLSLAEEPPPELARLENVYDWHRREGINYVWDASYYNGKYYYYWGPVPALLAAAIKIIHPGVVDDQYLLIIFLSILAISLGALFSYLHRRFFPSAPGWTVFAFTVTTGLAAPVLFLANRPSVYETAISAAQCFLILGIYAALRASAETRNNSGWFLLAGLSLGVSLASRFSHAPTLLFISLVTGAVILFGDRSRSHRIRHLAAFGLPLFVLTSGLLLFNYARFGELFETGMRYQLTGDALPEDIRQIYSLGYIFPNLYSDLFRPLHPTPGLFPFVTTPNIEDRMWPNYVHRPANYYSGEPVAGVFATIPFLWALLLLPVWGVVRFIRWTNEQPPASTKPSGEKMPKWMIFLLIGAFLIQFFFSLCFVMTTMRYLADFTPLLMICVSILIWSIYTRIPRPALQKLLLAGVVILCAASLLISFFVNMQSGANRFLNLNPSLYGRIAIFFSGYH